jgi:two-component system sensor histidine kinase DegS
LTLGKDGRKLWAEVTDDGCGFDPDFEPNGVGLSGMRERVEDLGGKLEITSEPGRGTTVRVSLSL